MRRVIGLIWRTLQHDIDRKSVRAHATMYVPFGFASKSNITIRKEPCVRSLQRHHCPYH